MKFISLDTNTQPVQFEEKKGTQLTELRTLGRPGKISIFFSKWEKKRTPSPAGGHNSNLGHQHRNQFWYPPSSSTTQQDKN